MNVKRWLWVAFGGKKNLPAPTPMRHPFVRLSDTKEIQLAFQQEMAKLFNEAGTSTTPPMPPSQVPTIVTEIIDGKAFRESIDDLERSGSLETLGFKPEHIWVLKSLAFLLAQCARLEATPQNLALFEPLFHPAKPTTPTVAEAMEEVVTELTRNT